MMQEVSVAIYPPYKEGAYWRVESRDGGTKDCRYFIDLTTASEYAEAEARRLCVKEETKDLQ
jgi:hypothetical protein